MTKVKNVELFTHPICSGCQEALAALRKLDKSGIIQLSVKSLGTAEGRKYADAEGITSVPTVRFDHYTEVLMGKSDLNKVLVMLESEISE